jgi:hypothetical protein
MDKREKSHIRQAAVISAAVCLTTLVGLIVFWQAQRFLREPISSVITPVRKGSGHQAKLNLLESIPALSSENQSQRVAAAAANAVDSLAAVVRLTIGSSTSPDQVALAQRLAQALQSAPLAQRQTAAQLVRFGLTGQMAELQNVKRADVEELAEYLAKQVPRTEIAEVLGRYLGFPRQTIMTAEDLAGNLMSLYDSMAGTAPVPDLGAPLVITDNCTTDARVIGHTEVLPAGVTRVYAVFENSGTLRGLDNVLVVWRMPADASKVYSKSEPLRSDAAYNYVWLQVDKGWPSGAYQVELYDPRNNAVALAKRQFDIQ